MNKSCSKWGESKEYFSKEQRNYNTKISNTKPLDPVFYETLKKLGMIRDEKKDS